MVKKPDGKPGVSRSGHEALEQKLGLSGKQINDNKLYAFISDWYGAPYKYGGCQKVGVDCSCFTSILYENVYGRELSRTAGEMFESCEKIAREQARQGDLFFFKINGNRVSHVGVYVGSNYFVHSSSSNGVVLSSIEEAYYKKYFFCAGRIKKT